MPKGGDPTDNPAALLQAQLAEQLFQETDPLRTGLIQRSQDFLGGDLDVTQSPIFRALKGGTEASFGRAREDIIGDVPTGGPLIAALGDLEARKAETLSFGTGRIAEDELSRALTLGTGITGQSLGALGQAGGIQQANVQSALEREGAIFGALGQGAGAYLGGK